MLLLFGTNLAVLRTNDNVAYLYKVRNYNKLSTTFKTRLGNKIRANTSVRCSRPGMGNPWHACRTWHAYTFYPARERSLRNEILPLSNEKNNNLQVAISLDEGLEIPSLLIMFLLIIRQLSQKLVHISFN